MVEISLFFDWVPIRMPNPGEFVSFYYRSLILTCLAIINDDFKQQAALLTSLDICEDFKQRSALLTLLAIIIENLKQAGLLTLLTIINDDLKHQR